MTRTRLVLMLMLIGAAAAFVGCTLSERPRSDRDPYVSDSSSDPNFRVGNPY